MIIARGLLVVVKVGMAIGCVVLAFLMFPYWYDICAIASEVIVDTLWFSGADLDAFMSGFLSIFPYLFAFLIWLGVYIVGVRMLDKMTNPGGEGE